MKKTLAFLLVSVLLFALLPATALAATQSGTWGGIDWTLTDDGTLTISPTTGTPVADPNCGKIYEVGEWREAVKYNSAGEGIAISGWPYDRTKVKTLVIKEGVTSIGSFTAQGFTNLTGEVVIPSTVTYIGQEAFQKSTFTSLTFASGGSEELCIAQGAFKNLIIETVELPADRPVHLHAWVFNNCKNLKSATIPASTTKVWGTNHIDYLKNFEAHSNPTWTQSSEIFAYDDKLETITFGDEATRDMFFSHNNATNLDYVIAYSGLVAYSDLQEAVDAAAEGDGEVVLLKNVTLAAGETLTIPDGVSITSESGKTLTNKGTIYLISSGSLDVTYTNVDDGVVIQLYQVSFVVNGETTETVLVVSGEDAELPTVPGKDGYTAEWNHDGKAITADTEITAVYTAIETEPDDEEVTEPEPDDDEEITEPAPENGAPVTGDNMNLSLYVSLAIISLLAILGVSVLRKREQF